MPRLPRLHVPGGCYHVILRGNHREDLFASADDRYELNGIVAQATEQGDPGTGCRIIGNIASGKCSGIQSKAGWLRGSY